MRVLTSILISAILVGCSTAPVDTKSDFEYALEAIERSDYEAGYRLIESSLKKRKNPTTNEIKNRRQAFRLLKTKPALLEAARKTFTQIAFQETIKRNNGNIADAMKEEKERLAIFQELKSNMLISTKTYNKALYTFKVTFKQAQDKAKKRMADYMWSRDIRDRLYAMSLKMDLGVLDQEEYCQGKARLTPISFSHLVPLSFKGASNKALKGVWTMRYQFDRCDESSIYNAIFIINKNGIANIYPLPPGTTRASPQLIKDLKFSLFMATVKHNKGDKDCRKMIVTDTKVTQKPKTFKVRKKMFKGVWGEQWSIRTCTGVFDVEYCFVPVQTGGTTWLQGKCTPASISSAIAVNSAKKK